VTNPLLQIEFRIPFDQIRAEHVEPAIDQLIADARERQRQIAGNRVRTPSGTPSRLWRT
jgi:oligopeptidase A